MGHHSGFAFNALATVNKRNAALLGKGHSQIGAGNRLHDGADHGNVHLQGAFFLTLFIFYQRSFQAYIVGNVISRGLTGYQQILTKGAGRFFKIISHKTSPFLITFSEPAGLDRPAGSTSI